LLPVGVLDQRGKPHPMFPLQDEPLSTLVERRDAGGEVGTKPGILLVFPTNGEPVVGEKNPSELGDITLKEIQLQ